MLTIDMLDRFACPECKNFSMELKSSSIENYEIIKGEIVCLRCHRQYPINEGIPDLFFSLDEIIHLFRRFSGLEIKNYDSCLKFFKAKKKQVSSKYEV